MLVPVLVRCGLHDKWAFLSEKPSVFENRVEADFRT